MSPIVDGLVADLRGDGPAEACEFTLDRAAAREKLRQFQLEDPWTYVLLWVQAAVLKRATSITIAVDRDRLDLCFDGEPFTLSDFDQLYGAPLGPRHTAGARALAELAQGLQGAMAIEPREVEIASGDGARAARLQARPGQDDRYDETPDTWVGTRIRVSYRRRRHRRAPQQPFGEVAYPDEIQLRHRCLFTEIPVTVNGERVSAGFVLPHGAGVVPIPSPEAGGIAGFVPDLKYSLAHFVVNGVLLTTRKLDLEPQGFVAVLRGDGLRKDLSQFELVEDEAFARVMQAIGQAERASLQELATTLGASAPPAAQGDGQGDTQAGLSPLARRQWLARVLAAAGVQLTPEVPPKNDDRAGAGETDAPQASGRAKRKHQQPRPRDLERPVDPASIGPVVREIPMLTPRRILSPPWLWHLYRCFDLRGANLTSLVSTMLLLCIPGLLLLWLFLPIPLTWDSLVVSYHGMIGRTQVDYFMLLAAIAMPLGTAVALAITAMALRRGLRRCRAEREAMAHGELRWGEVKDFEGWNAKIQLEGEEMVSTCSFEGLSISTHTREPMILHSTGPSRTLLWAAKANIAFGAGSVEQAHLWLLARRAPEAASPARWGWPLPPGQVVLRRRLLWAGAVAACLSVLAVPTCRSLLSWWAGRTPGRTQTAGVIRLPSGRTALLITTIPDLEVRRFWKLQLVDVQTGGLLAKSVVSGGPPRCVPATPGRIWCVNTGRESSVEARDAATLKVIAGRSDLRSRNRTQAALFDTELSARVDGAGHLLLESRGRAGSARSVARYHRLDGRTLRLQASTMKEHCHGTDLGATHGYGPSVLELPQGTLWFSSGHPEHQLLLDRGWNVERRQQDREVLLQNKTFIDPRFLGGSSKRSAAIRLSNPLTILVAHASSVDHLKSRLLLTAVAMEGGARVLWSVQAPAPNLCLAHLSGTTLAVVVGASPSYALGIDVRSGRVRWRRRL
ncbi:MAG: hypothetical protein RBU30_10680 [Polyangia bacterium]|jgi:hypothetical protein|nr:hypothetical protein [Polyangia bacterium]